MQTQPIPERVERFEAMRREGRLLRRAWTDTAPDGRERACWLTALVPEVRGSQRPTVACPAEVMPEWLAHLTPLIDDSVSMAAWPELARRYGACAREWHHLDAAAWGRTARAVRLEALAIALAAEAAGERFMVPSCVKLLRADSCAAAEASSWAAAAAAWAAAALAARGPAPWAAAAAARAAAWDRIATALFDALDLEIEAAT